MCRNRRVWHLDESVLGFTVVMEKYLVTAKSRETLVRYVSFVTKVVKEAHFDLKIAEGLGLKCSMTNCLQSAITNFCG